MRTRAWRRFQRERILEKTFRMLRSNHMLDPRYWVQNDIIVYSRKRAKTAHPCSKACCGNPRRWCSGQERFTMQERRQPKN